MVKIILISAVIMLIALLGDLAFLFAISFPVLMFSWMYLGALKKGEIGKGYKHSLLGLLIIWLGGFISMNMIDTTVTPEIYVGGFPLATFIMVYIVWAIPFLLCTYTFGYFFEREFISREELSDILSKISTEREG